MALTTGFRADLRAGCYDILVAVKAANPTLLDDVWPTPPESHTGKSAYVDKAVRETITHQGSTRTRTLEAGIVVVNKLMSNEQAADEQDGLVDLIVNAVTATPRAASSTTMIEPVGVADFEIPAGDGVRFSAARIAVRGTIREGTD